MRALVWLGLVVAIPSTVAAQVAGDTGSTSLRKLVVELSPSARLRLTSSGERWSGRLEARHADSLTSHKGLAAGAGFGALMFALLQLGNRDDRYYATRLGAIIFVGAAGAGLLIDGASDGWSRRYPE